MGGDARDEGPATTMGNTIVTGGEHLPSSVSIHVPGDGVPAAMRYKLGALLGRGGMGEVLSAHDEQIGRSVAIKRMRGTSLPADAIARFLREARIQGRLEHPAIVPVHELWHDEQGHPFFVMKQLSGVTLGDVLAKLAAGDADTEKAFPRQRLLRAFGDICLAIEFAHTRGIVHRDLKPANIVLGDFGEAYVLDWGIARVSSHGPEASISDADEDAAGDKAGSVLGTPGYMSPDQLMNLADLDGRSDVYSLGAILFEVLCGGKLHAGADPVASTMAGADARASVRAPARDIPPELDAICAVATARDRDDRYASARELFDAVQRFLDGDRDHAMRKELAHAELDAARAALARGKRIEDRQDAFRAAGRALALDPKGGAAELVASLMLSPPEHPPREVEDRMRRLDDDALFASRRLTVAMFCSYLVFFPILYASGLHSAWFMAGGATVCVATALAVWFMPRAQVAFVGYVGLAGNLAMLFLFGRLVGSFIAPPGIAVIVAMTFGTHVRIVRPSVLAALICAAVVGPWLVGMVVGWKDTLTVSGDALEVHTAADQLVGWWAIAGAVVYIPLLIGMAVFLTRGAAADRRKAQRDVEVQAWQLRQLVA